MAPSMQHLHAKVNSLSITPIGHIQIQKFGKCFEFMYFCMLTLVSVLVL
jgi:hypothetical protein